MILRQLSTLRWRFFRDSAAAGYKNEAAAEKILIQMLHLRIDRFKSLENSTAEHTVSSTAEEQELTIRLAVDPHHYLIKTYNCPTAEVESDVMLTLLEYIFFLLTELYQRCSVLLVKLKMTKSMWTSLGQFILQGELSQRPSNRRCWLYP